MFPNHSGMHLRQDGRSVQGKPHIHIAWAVMSWGNTCSCDLSGKQVKPHTECYEMMKQVLWFMAESTWYCQPTSLSQLSIPPTPRTAAAIVR